MEKIPIVKEFLNQGLNESGFELTETHLKVVSANVKQLIKLHVEAALKAASEEAEINVLNYNAYEIDKESILNSYPLENIK
jgi:hypothetical protein